MYGGQSLCMMYAEHAGVVCKSTEDLAKMNVIVTILESAGLTVCIPKNETTPLRTINKDLPAPSLVIEAAGQRYVRSLGLRGGNCAGRRLDSTTKQEGDLPSTGGEETD